MTDTQRQPSSEPRSHEKIAVFGGVYNNHLALKRAVEIARERDVDGIYCLGDLGAFGPHPNRVFPILLENEVSIVRGNYDDSIGRGLGDCQCGYTDPRDNEFAALSYRYTFARTDPEWRPMLRGLPDEIRLRMGNRRLLLCHGSPRQMNEFLWESSTSTAFLDRIAREHEADVILATHTGIKWKRALAENRLFLNVGALGRPENDGTTNVWMTIVERDDNRPEGVRAEFIPVEYDHERLAAEMRAEKLPEEFVETVLTGWWTTCLEILPAKERKRGRF